MRRRVVVRRPAIVRGKRDTEESLKRTKRNPQWLRPSVARRRVVVRRPTLVRTRPIFASRYGHLKCFIVFDVMKSTKFILDSSGLFLFHLVPPSDGILVN